MSRGLAGIAPLPDAKMWPMPMRQECKHFESRTYANGETVRKCDLDLAPDAPWRCPADCPSFERRTDVGWTYGSMVAPKTPEEPPGLDDGTAAAVLDEAEEFLREVGAQVMHEVHLEARAREAHPARDWKRIFRRKP